ncbi:hypothetical protein GJ496_004615 [Pomphorhynchus laevis]|nr:hypothetical protein GJ496_004615 [Pomphorhynchus laevis]
MNIFPRLIDKPFGQTFNPVHAVHLYKFTYLAEEKQFTILNIGEMGCKWRQSNNYILWIVLLSYYGCSHISAENGQCVWYGECPLVDNLYNCKYDGPAKKLNEDGYKILRSLCPHLDKGANSTFTCCDNKQLQSLKLRVGLLSDFTRRCPACEFNLRGFFCEMTCAGNQSSFMTTTSNAQSIVDVNLSVSRQYIESVLASCRSVQFASAGQDALQVICQKDAELCKPEDLMKIFEKYSPFPLHIGFKESGMSTTSWNCSVPIKFPSMAFQPCSCSDCKTSCPSECPFEEEKLFKIGHIDGYMFISIILYLLLLSVFVGYSFTTFVYGKLKALYAINIEENDEQQQFNEDDAQITAKESLPLLTNELEQISAIEMYHELFGRCCARVGRVICDYWWIFIPVGLLTCTVLSSRLGQVKLTTDPNVLWSVRNSRALKDKQNYDNAFGPFYRTTQILIQSKEQSKFYKNYVDDPLMIYTFDNSLSKENLIVLSDLQSSIEALKTESGISLSDVCYNPVGDGCAIFSAMEYFQNNITNLDLAVGSEDFGNLTADFASHLIQCLRSPLLLVDEKLNLPCMARYGGPVEPFLAVAGYSNEPTNCTMILLTYMLNSTDNRSTEWENEFLNFMNQYNSKNSSRFITFYTSERSIQDQILIESWADLRTIAISYLCMFAYVTLALSRYRSNHHAWIISGSKISLSMVSILLVLLAVTSSIGLFSFLNIPTTLLIFEVLPFLILAIGVDNMFIISGQCQIYSQHLCPIDSVANTLHKVGPGLILANTAEVCAFFLAALLSSVYAVRLFALNAAIALILNIVLQLIVFVPLVYLDLRRAGSMRPDIFCCFAVNQQQNQENVFEYSSSDVEESASLIEHNRFTRCSKHLRTAVVLLFLIFPCISVALLSKLQMGLEPSITVPDNSYLQKYLDNVKSLNTGPPVFFVLENANLNDTDNQNAVCSGIGCNPDSIMEQFSTAEVFSNLSFIAKSPSSWLDGYIDWIGTYGCCRTLNDDVTFCPSSNLHCKVCEVHIDEHGRPSQLEFDKYLQFYLQDVPNEFCPFGGNPLYRLAVKPNTSYFMGYHKTLTNSKQFISALRNSWDIVDRAKQYLQTKISSAQVNLYSYSIFYVFYEQYLSMKFELLVNMAVALAVVFVISFLLTGFNLLVSLAVLLTVWMIIMDMIGLMVVWSVTLNAVSMVNLIMSIGIAVEFCAHIAMNFARNTFTVDCPRQRSILSIWEVGFSVFAGIGITKLIGISVLAFAHSKLFSILFFRMYLCLVLLGILHGIIFLPILLSLIGQDKEGDDQAELWDFHSVTVFPEDVADSTI